MFKKKGGFKGGKKFGGGFRSERPEMHEAVCSQCDSMCEVPFKPSGTKPVFCKNCFRKDENGGERYERPRSYEKPAFRSQSSSSNGDVVKQLEMLNAKMDQLIRTLSDRGGRESMGRRGRERR